MSIVQFRIQRVFKTNIQGVQNLLDAVKSSDGCRFLQISTDEVYGSIATGSADENYSLLPNSPYAASKAAIVAISRGIARELATKKIRSNIISPGIVNVGMAAKQWREESDYRLRAQRAIPLGYLQDPLSVAHGIEFLLSEKSSYMTGSNLLIDGGASLYPLDPEEVI